MNEQLWPRCEIELTGGKIVVVFSPRTLALIERESGLSSMEFAEKFSDAKRAPLFDLGMKIILGAVRSVVPDMTEELLSERIAPGSFLRIFEAVAEHWAKGVSLAGGELRSDMADPTRVEGASPSST